jgi:hypothetical protein
MVRTTSSSRRGSPITSRWRWLTNSWPRRADVRRRRRNERNLLEQRVHTLVEELERRGGHRALGESAPWKQALVHATKVANTDTTVLITGESGPQPHPSFIGVFCPAALSERDRAVAGTGQSDERMS